MLLKKNSFSGSSLPMILKGLLCVTLSLQTHMTCSFSFKSRIFLSSTWLTLMQLTQMSRMKVKRQSLTKLGSPSIPTHPSKSKIASFKTYMSEDHRERRNTTRMKSSLFTMCTKEQFTAGNSLQSIQGLMSSIMSALVHLVIY